MALAFPVESFSSFCSWKAENTEEAALLWDGWAEEFFGIAIVILSDSVRHNGGLLDVTRPGGHVDKHNDEQHHHSQRGQDDGSHLLPRFLHGLLSLLLVPGGLLLGLAFELSHIDAGSPNLSCCADRTLQTEKTIQIRQL